MNATKMNVETCINGLKQIVMTVLKQHCVDIFKFEYVKLVVIRSESGIKDKLASAEGEQTYDHMFTSKLLESLLYEGCVENRFNTSGRKEWKAAFPGMLEYKNPEDDLETYIYGLEETLLESMIEIGGDRYFIRLKDIADKCGFEDKLHRVEGEPDFNNAFTHTLLHYLLRERRVLKSFTQRGEWIITDAELQKRLK